MMQREERAAMLTSEAIKERARQLGASVCGVGKIWEEKDPKRDPRMILPKAKCVVGFGFAVPKGLYLAMERGKQYYTYTTMGVKFLDEEMAEIFLLKIGKLIEDAGYDACLQRTVPNLKAQGDKTTNPEVMDTYELIYARAVDKDKPAPEVMIDFGKAARACGIGTAGKSGKIINRSYGPFMRYCFIVTDAPLVCDEPYEESLCQDCNACEQACPGGAISEAGVDTWQCSVYYKGAHKSNPFQTEDFLSERTDRQEILDGKKRFDAVSARELYPSLDFLPRTQWGYAPCLCGKKCDIACYRHLVGEWRLA